MFKVGAWVRSIDGLDICQIQKDTCAFYREMDCNMDNEWKLWKPKEGEFVIPKIIKGKAGTYISGFEVCMWTNDDVYECEPFIGKLPSFLKENR